MIRNFVFLIIIATSYPASSSCQSKQVAKICNCSVLVNPDFKGKVDLYKSPHGSRVRSIRHNFAEEDYLILKITKSSSNFFYVSANYSINGHIGNGWVNKKAFIGIYGKAYDDKDSLILYALPNRTSQVSFAIKKYTSQLLPVLDCDGMGWLRVQTKIGDKFYSGWLPSEMQCDNPYTTCN